MLVTVATWTTQLSSIIYRENDSMVPDVNLRLGLYYVSVAGQRVWKCCQFSYVNACFNSLLSMCLVDTL